MYKFTDCFFCHLHSDDKLADFLLSILVCDKSLFCCCFLDYLCFCLSQSDYILRVFWASWMFKFMSFIKFVKFLAIIYSKNCPTSFSFSFPSGTPTKSKLVPLVVPHRSVGLYSLPFGHISYYYSHSIMPYLSIWWVFLLCAQICL